MEEKFSQQGKGGDLTELCVGAVLSEYLLGYNYTTDTAPNLTGSGVISKILKGKYSGDTVFGKTIKLNIDTIKINVMMKFTQSATIMIKNLANDKIFLDLAHKICGIFVTHIKTLREITDITKQIVNYINDNIAQTININLAAIGSLVSKRVNDSPIVKADVIVDLICKEKISKKETRKKTNLSIKFDCPKVESPSYVYVLKELLKLSNDSKYVQTINDILIELKNQISTNKKAYIDILTERLKHLIINTKQFVESKTVRVDKAELLKFLEKSILGATEKDIPSDTVLYKFTKSNKLEIINKTTLKQKIDELSPSNKNNLFMTFEVSGTGVKDIYAKIYAKIENKLPVMICNIRFVAQPDKDSGSTGRSAMINVNQYIMAENLVEEVKKKLKK